MNKKIIIVVFTLCVLLSTGCSQNTPANKALNSGNTGSKPTISIAESEGAVSNINSKDIQGKINNIYYGDNNKVLISADKLYLYDLSGGSILAQVPKENFINEDYRVIKNGYVVLGKIQEKGSNNAGFTETNSNGGKCVFYDSNLKKLSEISFKTMIGDDYINSLEAITVSNDGKNIAFASNSGLFVYNTKQKKKTMLIDFSTEDNAKRLGISSMDQIAFINNDKTIAFKSQSFDVPDVPGQLSFDTYGTININGTGLSNKKNDSYSVKQLIPCNTCLLFAEDFKVATGKLMVKNLSDKQEKILSLKTKKESGNVYGSDYGKYFATSELNKSKLYIRVYNTQTGKLEKEQIITDDNSLYLARVPAVRVIDDSRTCIVLLGNSQTDIKTKLQSFQF